MEFFKKAFDYPPVVKTTDDVLDILEVPDEDRLIVKDAVLAFEKIASRTIKEDKCVRIPRIGQFKHSEYSKYKARNRKEFTKLRRSMDKEEFKNAMKVNFLNFKAQIRKEDNEKWAERRQANKR